MKKAISVITILTLSLMVLFTACNKNNDLKSLDEEFKNQEADLEFSEYGDFQKVITKPLVKRDDCKYVVEGTIQFLKGDKIVAIIDFGDGSCDNLATKTIGDKVIVFTLDKKGNAGKDYSFTKVIVEPLVKIDDCDFIVSGIIEFYKDDLWIATIDFGDGVCDEWATKTWDGGSKVFSLKKDKD